MTVGIVGLGLIGGSMAKAMRANTKNTILGCDIDSRVEQFAQLSDLLDGALTPETLECCELIILAAYPSATVNYLTENADKIKPGTLVMDCLGTKRRICEVGFALAERYGFTFVGGHPMAGSEHSGLKYASPTLFRGASLVLVPGDSDDIALMERLRTIFLPLGFSHIVSTTAQEHDRRIGFTSQLPHLLSNALVQSPTCACAGGFSAGSLRDLTRVAELNPALWTELFLENREHLLPELEGLISSLQDYRNALAEQNADTLCALLEAGRARKKELNLP